MTDLAIGAHGHFGSVVALDSIDLAVKVGSVLGLLGPNGAGKTTVVRILATILEPDAGQASVLGLDVVRKAGDVRAAIGLAGQYAAVDENLTGRENLRLIGRLTHQPRSVIAARAEELLDRFGLALKSAEAAAAASLSFVVLLGFPSSAFVSTSNLPGPLRAYADNQPLTATVNAVRPLLLGGPVTAHAVVAVIWCLGIAAVFVPLAVLRYRRTA